MTNLLPDFSEFLNLPGKLENEEAEWSLHAQYKVNADLLYHVLTDNECSTVLEVGCGTGWIPLQLMWTETQYIGVDKNARCIVLCHQKNPGVPFVQCDVRDLSRFYKADMVCAFAFFKHFGLHEWDSVIASILRRGKYSVFTMQISETDMDDGVEYPHTWVTMDRMEEVVNSAGHRIVNQVNPREAIHGTEWTFITEQHE